MEIGFNIIYGKHYLQRELANNLINMCIKAGIPVQKQKNNVCWINVLVSRSRVEKNDFHVIWQMDQPGNSEYNNLARYKNLRVWEFSYKSNEDRKSQDLNSSYLPFPLPDTDPFTFDISNKTIDILLIGTISDRRKKIIELLKENGINAKLESKCIGNEKINMISKSKIILNIHYYNPSYQETYRILEGLQYGACVISELSEDEYIDNNLAGPSILFIDKNLDETDCVKTIIEKYNVFSENIKKSNELEKINIHQKSILQKNQDDVLIQLKKEQKYFEKVKLDK